MTPPGSTSPRISPEAPRPRAPDRLTRPAVRRLAQAAGFVEAGMVNLPHTNSERDAVRFSEFIEAGFSGSMHYLARRNEAGELVRADLRTPFPWARSAVVCLASYHADAPLSTQPAEAGEGWIARYAWSGQKGPSGEMRPSDYHKVLLKRLENLESQMHSAFGEFEGRAYVDTGPIVERPLARAAGLGWTGKNTCLIHPKLGSWNFLAVLLTSLQFEDDVSLSGGNPQANPQAGPSLELPDRCGSCRRCLDACPTQALIEPYKMDATRCISYLTIEHRGDIPKHLRAGMGRQIFGCDICQDVCPWNRKAPIQTTAPLEVAQQQDLLPRPELINPALDWLAQLDRRGFEHLFNGSPVRRAGFNGFRRNLAIAMGNSGLRHFMPWLERQAANPLADASPALASSDAKEAANLSALAEAARWAIDRLSKIPEDPPEQKSQDEATSRPG